MFSAIIGSVGSGLMSVASLPAPFSRQTKPAEASASALTRSRLATNSAIIGSPTGALRRPMLICARWNRLIGASSSSAGPGLQRVQIGQELIVALLVAVA